MANSLAEVDNFVAQGVNAIEADLRFASDGTALKFYHGAICDCGRDCEKSAEITEYLSYLRDAVNEGGKFAGKLQLLYIDTKTGNLPPGRKFEAGISLANNLMRYLWNNGFDISGNELLSIVANTYEELGILQHRWQGDGWTNCLIDGYWDLRMTAVTSRRTAANTTHDYVDKAYVWTVDNPYTMRRFLRKNIDGLMTNVPTTLLNILKEDEFLKTYRLATSQDSPWKRIV
ncbi:dermonecrotic toxin SPH-like isoform X2 [Dermacentor andersoni]|uniref:dermonecrotic toxin SPH-like isoform X2 n=1 Tax=Dermacentor andersoni TaxID=34620 RepID=UPI003B3A0ACA